MKSLREKDHKASFNNFNYNSILSKEDLTLLNDLLIFNRRYEEAFFNSKVDEHILEMIDNIIDEKLKSVNSDLAFKFLNRIWSLYSEGNTTLDAEIINGVDFDLAAHRLSIQLLDRATDDGNVFINNYRYNSGSGLKNYFKYNFYNLVSFPGEKANKMLILDHVELFLALLNEASDIDKNLINIITDIYLFLYKDIYNEVLRNNLNEDSSIILAQRYKGYERMIIQSFSKIREEVFSIQFTFEAMVMLNIKDDEINKKEIEQLKIGKLYLDSLLMLLREYETDKVISYYQENEFTVDTRECTKALSYVKKSIEENDKKRNS